MNRSTLQHRTDSASSRGQQTQFLLTNGTTGKMCLDQGSLRASHFPFQISHQGRLDLFAIHSHTSIWEIDPFPGSPSSRIFRNVFRARSSRDLTVPSGTSRMEAISAYGNSQ